MNKKLFTLSPGDKFRFKNKADIFIVVKYKIKTLPRLGKTLLLVAIDTYGNEAYFTRNFDIEFIGVS